MNRQTKLVQFIFILLLSTGGVAQYAPPAGQPGTTAIAKDSSIIVAWATGVEAVRGAIDIADPSANYNGETTASFGETEDAIGPAEGGSGSVLSLGDGGQATLTFEHPIKNGEGPDFCVFENSFSNDFLELAFVEVSSNGTDFVRFPSHSATQTATQIGGFGIVDATKIYNFAGKYEQGYGVPFDLDELKDEPNLNIEAITHVRVIDVVGTIDPQFGSYDSQGNIVNDPYPTPFNTGGFDLDAIGVIHENTNVNELIEHELIVNFYPNPTKESLFVNAPKGSVSLYTSNGQLVTSKTSEGNTLIFDTSSLSTGIYFLSVSSQNQNSVYKVVVE